MNLREKFQDDYVVNPITGKVCKPLGLMWWLKLIMPALAAGCIGLAFVISLFLILP